MSENSPSLSAVSSLDDPVRARLYQIVSESTRPVGRDEAASAAGIGRPLAAYHLDKLVELGLLTASYQRPEGRRGPGAGRPAKVYSRSQREFAVTVPPREYELAARLLAAAVESDRSTATWVALQDRARQFGLNLGLRMRPAADDARGPQATIEPALREHGFEPVQQDDGSVKLRNCPFHKLAAEHPDLVCGMNLALIQGLAVGIGASNLRPRLDPGADRCCVILGAGNPSSESARTDA